MISTLNEIKKGIAVIHNNEPYVVVEANFVRMQAQKPVMQTKIKSLLTGKVAEITYHSNDKVQEADLKINVCKIKYSLESIKITCALKNVFGCNPYPKKFKYHSKFLLYQSFSSLRYF